ncbi:glycosyltransferase family 4 protein [bacterium SCSIO 12741]|nr:glycosyltransferase family 4 protein [bacterium SCSIO 12741]
MKIAVNTRLLLPNKLDGIGWFTYETLKRITQQRPEVEFIFLFDRRYHPPYLFSENVRGVWAGPPSRHPFLWYIWFGNTVPRLLNHLKPDLFLSPDGYLPHFTHVPCVPVIHDLNFEHHPEDLPFWYRHYYRHFFPKYAKKATRIATVSEYSKKDISERYGISSELIDVVYNGISEDYHPIDSAEKEKARQKYAGGKPYFLFIGSLHPRKNIARLIRAFDDFKKTQGSEEIQLVLAGRKKWWDQDMESAFQSSPYKSEIHFVPGFEQSEANTLVGGAELMVYPSTFEGFGVPPLEAMKAGVPVVVSNLTSMPEICGEAGFGIDPFNADSITRGLHEVWNNSDLRNNLIARGLNRSKEFTWQRSADLLWASVEKALS